jgi:hypothetical protein
MKNRKVFLFAALLAAAACSDSTGGGGGGTTPGDLTFLRLAATAPQLCADSVGAYFKKNPSGQDTAIALTFPEEGPDCNGSTEDFLRLTLKGGSLLRNPDSTLISNGDSVFIYVKWVGSDSVLFDLYPTGLVFDPENPAKLKINYGECGDDLNHDNQVDNEDHDVEQRLDIWRQEHPGDDFVRVGTAKSDEDKEIDARLNGFSRYAIAY